MDRESASNEPECPDLGELFRSFDAANYSFCTMLATYPTEPTSANNSAIKQKLDKIGSLHRSIVTEIAESSDYTIGEKLQTLITIHDTESATRAERLNKTVGTPLIVPSPSNAEIEYDDVNDLAIVNSTDEERATLIETYNDDFKDSLNNDMCTYMKHLHQKLPLRQKIEANGKRITALGLAVGGVILGSIALQRVRMP